ncbi:hypothetical protein H2198_000798 [Neophaeococcomyces mojaviensis]|uniref:Uncharacterized protein n=1 Tax=Neophaeococcomyces mojaviensis TaxID=3383035 RepID=A0ACC3AIX4_9EURO|nr:hypothetical protein H2198_000798 [Knufia sp. JES_112]
MPANPFTIALQRRGEVVRSDQENIPPSRERREQRVQAYPLGTIEDVQQEDYVSPITGMFTRAYDRFRIAEEVRRAEAQSAAIQARNDENTQPEGNPLINVQNLSSSLTLNPLANPFSPPNVSEGVQIQISSLLRGPPHRPRANFHRQFYNQSSRSLPQPEPDPMDEGPNPVDLQALQRPVPSQPESLKVDFACKVGVLLLSEMNVERKVALMADSGNVRFVGRG